MPVTRRCPRCCEWHPLGQRCRPRAADLTAWVAGTLHQQSAADGAEAVAIRRFRAAHAGD